MDDVNADARFENVPEFTADDIETIKALIEDWGFEYSLIADGKKVADLAEKLGVKR